MFSFWLVSLRTCAKPERRLAFDLSFRPCPILVKFYLLPAARVELAAWFSFSSAERSRTLCVPRSVNLRDVEEERNAAITLASGRNARTSYDDATYNFLTKEKGTSAARREKKGEKVCGLTSFDCDFLFVPATVFFFSFSFLVASCIFFWLFGGSFETETKRERTCAVKLFRNCLETPAICYDRKQRVSKDIPLPSPSSRSIKSHRPSRKLSFVTIPPRRDSTRLVKLDNCALQRYYRCNRSRFSFANTQSVRDCYDGFYFHEYFKIISNIYLK